MAEAWDSVVAPEDTVLLPGDLSWGRNLAEAAPDLEWIGRRPGRKILLRGNHDSWWTGISKVRSALPGGCEPLQNNAFLVEPGYVVIGARGWNAPGDPDSGADDRKVFAREIERLRMSIADADRNLPTDLPRVAMVHYPPWIVGRPPSEVVGILQSARVRVCVYGHLHGADHALGVVGPNDGIRWILAAADAVGFAPVEIEP